MILSAFQQSGLSFSINTGAANTLQQTTVLLSNLNITDQPTSLRVLNKGADDVWLQVSGILNDTSLIVPVPGTTTTGTPTSGVWCEPGVDLVFSMNGKYIK